jgi:predicted small lipoprotein YifL
MMRSLAKSLALLAAVLSLTGCGLAATSVTAAAGGATAAQQAKQAKDTEAKLQQQINAAYQEDAARRKAAEAQAQ